MVGRKPFQGLRKFRSIVVQRFQAWKKVGRKPFQGLRKFRSIVVQRFQAWKKLVEEGPM
jgi:hypothetical protein